MEEYRSLPVVFGASIPPNGNWEELVPNSKMFYEFLCGANTNAKNWQQFLEGDWSQYISEILNDNPIEGLLSVFSNCANRDMVSCISAEQLDHENLKIAIQEVIRAGSILAKVASIEFLFLHYEKFEPLKHLLHQLLDFFVGENGELDQRFAQTSSLIWFVDSEFSRRRLFPEMSVLRRRYTAHALASFLEGHLWPVGIHSTAPPSVRFLLQGYVDYWKAPDWFPEFTSGDYFRKKIYGRLCIAIMLSDKDELDPMFDAYTDNNDWRKFVNKTSFFPDPLTGYFPMEPDETLEKRVKVELSSPSIIEDSFSALNEFTANFPGKADHADFAVQALKRMEIKLGGSLGILDSLSRLAATTRSVELADLTFEQLSDQILEIEPLTVVRLIMTLAAARVEKKDWRESLGKMMKNYATRNLTLGNARELIFYLQNLVDIDPILWRVLGDSLTAVQMIVCERE